MAAVVAVLHESLTESLKGFYKLRKAFGTLQEIVEAEHQYLEKHHSGSGSSSLVTTRTATITPPENHSGSTSGVLTPVEDEEDDFKDAVEEFLDDQATLCEYQGHRDLSGLRLQESLQGIDTHADELNFRAITDDPIDIFIHSGAALCFGLLQLLLSLVPPAFSKILSMFSFRAIDRESALGLLWRATAFKQNLNGGMAGLCLLPFYNAAVALCEIHRREAYPKQRLQNLLAEMRQLYPRSIMWILEESRMRGLDRDLEGALGLLTRDKGTTSSMKQMEALRVFEMSMAYMFLHRYEECATSFLRCIELNNWSHGLYYYLAGSCYVELYREYRHTNAKLADSYRDKAMHVLNQVAANTGKKKFMARQLPLDVYISRKLAKWQQRAHVRGCDLVDAIGVSPIEEMIYFWSGYRRQSDSHLKESMARLAWSFNQPTWPNEAIDEKAILAVLQSTVLRNLGQTDQAKTMLAEHAFCYEPHQITACDHADSWALPVAHYELCVCLWNEAGGQDGDRAKLQMCSEELAKVEDWGSFELDARVGLKLTTARQTLTQTGIS